MRSRSICYLSILCAAAAATPASAFAQSAAPAARSGQGLDSLVREGMQVNPAVAAAKAQLDAARARISSSALRPDPQLMAGVINLPLGGPPFGDVMTMKMLGISQTITTGGKLSLRKTIAERDADAAAASLQVVKRDVERNIKSAFYEIAFSTSALNVIRRNQELLAAVVRAAETRYSVGTGSQSDILRAQTEAARLAETAAELSGNAQTQRARLNAALSRPSESPLGDASIPEKVRQAAAGNTDQITFESSALGAPASHSPFPALRELQDVALRNNPELGVQRELLATEAARLELTRRERIPDVDVAVQYGQRNQYPDMISATVSLPLPLQRRGRDNAFVQEAASTLAAGQSEYRAKVDAINAEVAEALSRLERERTQLALLAKIVVPQARASLSSSLAGYQVGKTDFLQLLDAQSTLFKLETEYERLLTDFATDVAGLERLTGTEVIQ